MADLSKIKLNNTTYNLKDAQARTIFEVEGILEGDGEGNISAAGTTATSTLNIDSEPTPDSDHLVTSGGIYAAIQAGSGIANETDPVFGASAAAGITSTDITNWNNKISDDHKWNDVALNHSTTSSAGTYYIPAISSTSGTAAYLYQTTASPTNNAIAKYNANSYLISTTPSSNDNSTKVATTAYVDGAISNLGSVLTYKGTKAAVSNLPTTGNTTGDVWHITADSSEYAWDGSNWQELGTAIDLSGYLQSSDISDWAKASTKPSYTASEVGAATSSHTHGNITNGGDITATAPTVASGDKIIINDESASKITNGPSFGTSTTTYLRNDGSWATPTDNDNRDPGYGKITPAGDTGTSAVTANTTQIAAGTYNEAFTFKTGNKWLTVAGTSSSTNGSDILTIGHSAGLTAKTSYGSTATTASANGGTITVTDIKYDEAGHITGSTDRTITLSQTTYTVGNKALKIASNTGTATQAITVNENSSDRTLTIKGDGTYLSGSVSGSANAVTVAITPSDSGATAGSYGDSANQTPGYGSTFKVPYITVDAKGRITEISEHTVKIPASDNTNTATAADGILDGSNSGTQITYAPYSAQQSKLSFDTSTTNPTRTDRLNLNGYFYATKVYSGGSEVLTSHQSLANYKTIQSDVSSPTASGTSMSFIDTISQNTNGVITATKKSIDTDTVTGISIDSAPTNESINLVTSGGVYTALSEKQNNLPAQSGNSGKFLTTNGSALSWAEALPTQTNNSGKFLTTNGTTASWATVSIPSASTTTPLMNGTASYGSGTTWARADHVHPTDTSRAPLASPTFTGTPAAPTASAGTNTTQVATTAFVQTALTNKITYGTTDLTSGTSALATGVVYLVYE